MLFVPQIPEENSIAAWRCPNQDSVSKDPSQSHAGTASQLSGQCSLFQWPIIAEGSQKPCPQGMWTNTKTLPSPSFPFQCILRCSEKRMFSGSPDAWKGSQNATRGTGRRWGERTHWAGLELLAWWGVGKMCGAPPTPFVFPSLITAQFSTAQLPPLTRQPEA